MNEKEIRATAPENKPVRLGDLPIVKTNILEVARDYDKGIVGGYNGMFPLTAASKGGIYLLPQTGKFYVCTENYNGTQISAPNDKFVELSAWKNHDRLNNLENIKFVFREDSDCTQVTTFEFECKEILLISVLPWDNYLTYNNLITDLTGKVLKVKTSTGGCKVFAVLHL